MPFQVAHTTTGVSPAGQWLVCEVPGAVLLGGRPARLWKIVQFTIPADRFQETWGKDWVPSAEFLKLKEDGSLNQGFSSRSEALFFLESQLSQQPVLNILSEML